MTTTRRTTQLGGAVLLAAAIALASPADAAAFNDEYVFAATREVNRMDMHPALKVTLFPVTIAVDLVFLPFATVAGMVS